MDGCAIPRIIVQPDWQESLREKNGIAWISYKKSGLKTVYGELKRCTGSAGDGVSITSSDGFSVTRCTPSRITVTFTEKEGVVHSQKCQAPSRTFPNIHATKKQVTCLDVTSGGLGVSSDIDGRLNVWTTDNGEIRRTMTGHVGDVYVCRYFPSGVVVLSGGADCRAKIWSAETGECAATLTGHSAGVTDVAIVERGRNVVSVSRDGSARLWDCGRSASLMNYIVADNPVINGCCLGIPSTELAFPCPENPTDEREVSTEGKLLLLACENHSLQGVGLQSRKLVFEAHLESAVNCCTFLTNTLVACGTQDSVIHVLDLRKTSQPILSQQESRSSILSMQQYKKGLFATTGDGSCWYTGDISSGCTANTVTEFTGPDCDPVYRSVTDGRFLFTCSRDSYIRSYSLSDIIES